MVNQPMESADTVAIATWKGTERGRETGKVVNKMGVWIVIRIWEGGIDFSHFSF